MAELYASGTWQVTEGKEEEFVQRWTEFLTWSRRTHPGLRVAHLMRDDEQPGHYLSISEWADEASRAAWRQAPEFRELYGACVALCETSRGADYEDVVTI
jgi:heme-degrading monooxygenase HmoA